jgi:predicted transposase/invertase (TIGR01784 family)
MQMYAQESYPKRIVYYAAKMHQQQLHEGEDYSRLQPTISISFVNSVLFPGVADYHLRFLLLEETHRFALTDAVEFHIIELPKFHKSPEELRGDLDIWLYFLLYAEKMDTEAIPAALRQPLVLRAIEELKMLAQTDIERERYEARRKAQLDYNSGLKEARREGEMIGAIHVYERLLHAPETPVEQLEKHSLAELTRMADALRSQVEHRS